MNVEDRTGQGLPTGFAFESLALREPAFDDIVQLAADILHTPMAALCLIAEGRLWLKAEIGLGIDEAVPDMAIGAQAAFQPGVFVVPDAARDSGFARHPWVSGAPHMRFYAGALLETPEALPLGVLCVLDTDPRPQGISERQRRALTALAGQVMAQLDLRRALARDLAHRQILEQAQRAAGLGVWQWEIGTQALKWSDELCRIAGRDPMTFDVTCDGAVACLHPDDVSATLNWLQAAAQGDSCPDHHCRIVRPSGEVRHCWINRSQMPGQHDTATVIGGLCQDITDRQRAEQALRESEEHYRYSVELNPQIPWTAGPDGQVEEVSHRWQALTGILADDAYGEGWVQALHPDDVQASLAEWKKALQTGRPVDAEYRLRMRDGGYRWFRARAAARRDDSGRIVRWYGTLEDIHDSKLADKALRESEERLQLAVKVTGLGIWDYDARARTRRWSRGLRTILGVDSDTPADNDTFLALVHPDDRAEIVRQLAVARDPSIGSEFESVFRIQRANDGAWRWVTAAGRKLFDSSGKLSRVISTLRDVTEQHTAEENIRWAATHDPLTQLPNRFLFQEELDQALQRPAPAAAKLGLLLLDVDQFKQINDTLGHDAGDALLRAFGERLRAGLRSGDMVARLGGDEFGVILQNINGEQDIRAAVASLLDRLREPFIYDGRIVDCRASIGGSLYPDHAGNSADLRKHADIALYMAKGSSRGGLVVFDVSMHANMQRRFSMHHLARRAVDAGRIIPFYQPKIDLNTGHLTGFEALLRWKNGRGAIQLPASIAAAFEDINLATAIGNCMLENVVGDMQRWLHQGLDFGHVALNASAAEFRHDDLAERILGRLQAAEVPTHCLELEVTETVFLGRGSEYVERALKTLSAEGVRIALDDFGTGYASLLHLKQYPVDIIKMDQSFVRDLEEDSSDAAIVRAVLNLGQSLGISIVAEGIETPAQAAYLWAQGCDFGQGYLFGKPMAAGRIPGLISGWTPSDDWKAAVAPRAVSGVSRRFDAVT